MVRKRFKNLPSWFPGGSSDLATAAAVHDFRMVPIVKRSMDGAFVPVVGLPAGLVLFPSVSAVSVETELWEDHRGRGLGHFSCGKKISSRGVS